MTPEDIADRVRAANRSHTSIEVVGGGTLTARLGAPADAGRVTVTGCASVVAHEPADLVIRVGAGMTVSELDAVLAAAGQECPLDDPLGHGATVGGRIATALGGHRQLGCGPVRDWILGATIVTGDGRLVRVGGHTVKNVTGYDLPRLLCGSWGTLAVLLEVTLRVRPRPWWSGWYGTEMPPGYWVQDLYAPASVLLGEGRSWVLLEGHREDAQDTAVALGLVPCAPPELQPAQVRISVPPRRLPGLLEQLPARDRIAEWGVGIVHLRGPAAEDEQLPALVAATGGRMLRVGGAGLADDLRSVHGNHAFHRRLRSEFDPGGVLAPWRLAA